MKTIPSTYTYKQRELHQLLEQTQQKYCDTNPQEKTKELYNGNRREMKERWKRDETKRNADRSTRPD